MKKKGTKIEWRRLALAVVICLVVGNLGAAFAFRSIPGWYQSLNKASFNPPDWVFAPAWTVLYVLMGISLYLVWNSGLPARRTRAAIWAFAAQLLLNSLWSVLFFGLRSPLYGMAGIIALLVAVAVTIVKFAGISRQAAGILVPYMLWISFAAVLNYYVLILNP